MLTRPIGLALCPQGMGAFSTQSNVEISFRRISDGFRREMFDHPKAR